MIIVFDEFGERSKYFVQSIFLKTMAEEYSQRSKAWYLLPIFLGIIGGIIGFFVLRHDSPKMARNCLIIGVITLAIGIALSAAGSLTALNGMTGVAVP